MASDVPAKKDIKIRKPIFSSNSKNNKSTIIISLLRFRIKKQESPTSVMINNKKSADQPINLYP